MLDYDMYESGIPILRGEIQDDWLRSVQEDTKERNF